MLKALLGIRPLFQCFAAHITCTTCGLDRVCSVQWRDEALWRNGEWTRGDWGSWRLPCLCAANQAFDTCCEISRNTHQTFSINKTPATLITHTSRSASKPASLSLKQKWLTSVPGDWCLAGLLTGLCVCDCCIISAICSLMLLPITEHVFLDIKTCSLFTILNIKMI